MANTFITNTSKFKPFSFQEMLQPYQMYTDAYNKADEELNALLEDAATKGFNFAPQDTVEAAAYNTIIDRIKTASDQLAGGLNPQLSKEINQLNKDYRKVMLPIQQQLNKRAELAAEQRELLAKNPNLRFTKNYSTEALKDITNSSTYNIIDLKALEEVAGENFGKEMASIVRTDLDSIPIEDTGYSYVTQGFGINTNEFDLLINNDNIVESTGDYNVVYRAYKKQVDEIDARTDISPAIKQEMKEAVRRGMRANAGKFTTDVVKTHSSKEEREKFDIMSVDENGNALATYNGAVMKGKVKPDGMGGYTPIDIENWKKIGSENRPGNNNGKSGSSSSSSGSDSGEKPSIIITETEETDAFGRKTKKTQVQQKVTPTQYDSIQQKKAEELIKRLEDIKIG